jgi:DNA invertase Pin-like site-specific DNA recombinase
MMKASALILLRSDPELVAVARQNILRYLTQHRIHLHRIITLDPLKLPRHQDRVNYLLANLNYGSGLVTCNFSDLGQSAGQVLKTLESLIKHDVRLSVIDANFVLNNSGCPQQKHVATLLNLLIKADNDLVATRTRNRILVAKSRGRALGRPKGVLGKSILDGSETRIERYLRLGLPKTAIANLLGISRTTLLSFLKSRRFNLR